MPEYILVVDTGSTTIKAVLFDTNGLEICISQTTLPLLSPETDFYSRDANSIWEHIAFTIREILLYPTIDPGDIIAITCVGHGCGMILLDSEGNPTYAAISSNDTRAKGIVDEWHNGNIEAKIHPQTLQHIWAGQTAPLLKWMKINKPDILKKSAHFILIKDYIRYRLTGNIHSDKSDISATSLYNVKSFSYDDSILEAMGLLEEKHLFPEARDSTDISGYITEKAERETGLKRGIPVITGVYDAVASTLSSGLVNTDNKENLILNILAGTWAIDQYLTKTPQCSKNIFGTLIPPSPNHWIVCESSFTSTNNIDWYISNFLNFEKEEMLKNGETIYELCDKALSTSSPSDSDIIFLPFISGSNIGSKVKHGSELNATFYNLTSMDKQEDIIRAIYEGITFSHLYQINKMFYSVPQTLVVRLVGGGAKSKIWPQIFADILQAPVETMTCHNTNALGAAICASAGIKKYASLEEAVENMVTIKDRFEPNIKMKDVYAEKFFRYKFLIAKLTGSRYNYD